MNCLRSSLQIPIDCGRILVTAFRNGFTSLASLFRARVYTPDVVPVSPTLSHLNIKVGGVENGGNTCIISVLFQEMAAMPAYYDVFLNTPLKRGDNESESHFSSRKELQTLLRQCVKKIRSNELVKKDDVLRLSTILVGLGWQKETTSYWRRLLHRLAPKIFSLPLTSPYEVYEKVLSLFPETSFSPEKICLLSRTSSVSVQQFFENQLKLQNIDHPILLRVAEDYDIQNHPLEKFQIKNRLYSLQLIHVFKDTPRGKHVIMYRKVEDKWICCNDAEISKAEALPSKNIYTVVYESRITSK